MCIPTLTIHTRPEENCRYTFQHLEQVSYLHIENLETTKVTLWGCSFTSRIEAFLKSILVDHVAAFGIPTPMFGCIYGQRRYTCTIGLAALVLSRLHWVLRGECVTDKMILVAFSL